jgi:hypothetical protein
MSEPIKYQQGGVMMRIVLNCSDPKKGCEWCVFNTHDGCRAPMGLTDCYTKHGIWQIEEAEEQGGKK